MTEAAPTTRQASAALVGAAVNRSALFSTEGLVERLFTVAFSGLVYPQIWEDPLVDLDALQLTSTSRVVTIASGGCNVMSYATAAPEHIAAVDLNADHVALNRMKLTAAQHLTQQEFFELFGDGDRNSNAALFDTRLVQHLDRETAAYWTSRDWRGRRRIEVFTRNFYRTGLLGRFITVAHAIARLHGVDPSRVMQAKTIDEQRAMFERDLAPLLKRRAVRWMINRPASLFGLGIPPAQYRALAGDHEEGIAEVLRLRLERLACGFPLSENYFARQAFGRGYGGQDAGALPPYLTPERFGALKANAGRARATRPAPILRGCSENSCLTAFSSLMPCR